jgi:E3 ubiquitin-protein ligase EDD1
LYALSLMRAHSDEHSDSLPVIDISALKHVAYVFDALIYYMRSGTDTDTDIIRDGMSVHSWQDHEENENEAEEDDLNTCMAMETESNEGESDLTNKTGRKHSFFQRSDSTLFLGCPPPDPFETPLTEALPLADQPHLLQPNSRREDMFGVPRQTVKEVAATGVAANQPVPFDKLPTHMGLSVRTADTVENTGDDTMDTSPSVQPGSPQNTEEPASTNRAQNQMDNSSQIPSPPETPDSRQTQTEATMESSSSSQLTQSPSATPTFSSLPTTGSMDTSASPSPRASSSMDTTASPRAAPLPSASTNQTYSSLVGSVSESSAETSVIVRNNSSSVPTDDVASPTTEERRQPSLLSVIVRAGNQFSQNTQDAPSGAQNASEQDTPDPSTSAASADAPGPSSDVPVDVATDSAVDMVGANENVLSTVVIETSQCPPSGPLLK